MLCPYACHAFTCSRSQSVHSAMPSPVLEQMGMTYAYADCEGTPPELMECLQNVYLDRRIACYVGDDVYY